MYEIRIYRVAGKNKVRTLKIKKSGNWFGLFGWVRLWFRLRREETKRLDRARAYAQSLGRY